MATERGTRSSSFSFARKEECKLLVQFSLGNLTLICSHLLLLPPNTTHLYQALDKLFTTWHAAYIHALREWKLQHPGMAASRQAFMQCFSEAWPKWGSPEQIKAAFERVGWSESGINKEVFPNSDLRFQLSENCKYALYFVSV